MSYDKPHKCQVCGAKYPAGWDHSQEVDVAALSAIQEQKQDLSTCTTCKGVIDPDDKGLIVQDSKPYHGSCVAKAAGHVRTFACDRPSGDGCDGNHVTPDNGWPFGETPTKLGTLSKSDLKDTHLKRRPLNEDMDANRWVAEFKQRIRVMTHDEVSDVDFLRAWFANAIMCGYDNGVWKTQAEQTRNEEEVLCKCWPDPHPQEPLCPLHPRDCQHSWNVPEGVADRSKLFCDRCGATTPNDCGTPEDNRERDGSLRDAGDQRGVQSPGPASTATTAVHVGCGGDLNYTAREGHKLCAKCGEDVSLARPELKKGDE